VSYAQKMKNSKTMRKINIFDFQLPANLKGGEGGGSAVAVPLTAVAVVNAVDVLPDVPLSYAKVYVSPSPETGEGEKTTFRKRKRTARPEYIREARRHIAGAWKLKTGIEFEWTPLYRANLRYLMKSYRACEIMALWDLFIETRRGQFNLYEMQNSIDRLWLDSRFKPLVRKYDDLLFSTGRRVG